jgi:hypothetical protein
MKLKIKVTKEVIEASRFCGCSSGNYKIVESCAIALAIREIFPAAKVQRKVLFPFGYTHVTVSADSLFGYNKEGKEMPKIDLPPKAIRFIKSFDLMGSTARLRLQPIEFEIVVPEEVIKAISIEEVTSTISKSKTLEIV